jgi:hypothetical protein
MRSRLRSEDIPPNTEGRYDSNEVGRSWRACKPGCIRTSDVSPALPIWREPCVRAGVRIGQSDGGERRDGSAVQQRLTQNGAIVLRVREQMCGAAVRKAPSSNSRPYVAAATGGIWVVLFH